MEVKQKKEKIKFLNQLEFKLCEQLPCLDYTI